MKKFEIKEGKKYFKPFKLISDPRINIRGFKLRFKIMPGAWSSKSEWNGDGDFQDWMKVGGFTSFFGRNDSNAILTAFRYGKEFETYQITGYTNYPKTAFKFGETEETISIIKSGIWCEMTAEYHDSKITYTMEDGKTLTHPFEMPILVRSVSPYPGGGNNSPGPFGGKAFKDMTIFIEITSL